MWGFIDVCSFGSGGERHTDIRPKPGVSFALLCPTPATHKRITVIHRRTPLNSPTAIAIRNRSPTWYADD